MNETERDEMTERMILETIEAGEKLIEEAESRLAAKQKLLGDIDLDPEDCRRFLQGDKLTEEQKKKASKEIQDFIDEAERDRKAAAEGAKPGIKSPPKPSARKVKI